MKILFYEGNLLDFFNNYQSQFTTSDWDLVDARNGPKKCYERLMSLPKNSTIITNSLVALSHVFGWNEKENCTDIYLWREKYHDFIRCDRLTMKDIREGHNIEKMYMADVFDEEIYEKLGLPRFI